jgi:hypothetical protein
LSRTAPTDHAKERGVKKSVEMDEVALVYVYVYVYFIFLFAFSFVFISPSFSSSSSLLLFFSPSHTRMV